MSEFEKKIIEFKEKIKVAKNLSELTKINSEIFGKNGIINLEFKKHYVILPNLEKSTIKKVEKKTNQKSKYVDKDFEYSLSLIHI